MDSTSQTWLKVLMIIVLCCVAAGALFCEVGISTHSILHFAIGPVAYAYFWIPFLFTAFWLGYRKLSWSVVLAFAVAETLAVLFVILDVSMHLYIFIYK